MQRQIQITQYWAARGMEHLNWTVQVTSHQEKTEVLLISPVLLSHLHCFCGEVQLTLKSVFSKLVIFIPFSSSLRLREHGLHQSSQAIIRHDILIRKSVLQSLGKGIVVKFLSFHCCLQPLCPDWLRTQVNYCILLNRASILTRFYGLKEE